MPAPNNTPGRYTVRLKRAADASWEDHLLGHGRKFSDPRRLVAEAEALLLLEQGLAYRVQVLNDNNLVVWERVQNRCGKALRPPEEAPSPVTNGHRRARCSECGGWIAPHEEHYRGPGTSPRSRTPQLGKWHTRCWEKARARCAGE